MKERYVHLTPRLIAALSMLKGAAVVADIGCDHGRLTAALLQQNICARVIATDISEPSLQKAKDLLGHVSLSDRVSFRAGDGLDPLSENECDGIATDARTDGDSGVSLSESVANYGRPYYPRTRSTLSDFSGRERYLAAAVAGWISERFL